MLATINLHQLAQTRAPGPRLAHLRRTLPARDPQAGVGHQVAHGFLRQRNPVAFAQFLARQRRAKVRVTLADDRQGPYGQTCVQLPVARTLMSARANPGGTPGPVTDYQPLDLPHTQPEPLGSPPGLQSHLDDRLDHLQSVEFAHVQCHQFGLTHAELPQSDRKHPAWHPPQNTTSVSC